MVSCAYLSPKIFFSTYWYWRLWRRFGIILLPCLINKMIYGSISLRMSWFPWIKAALNYEWFFHKIQAFGARIKVVQGWEGWWSTHPSYPLKTWSGLFSLCFNISYCGANNPKLENSFSWCLHQFPHKRAWQACTDGDPHILKISRFVCFGTKRFEG